MTAPLKLTPFDAFVDADGRPESRRLKELRAYWEKKCDRRAAPARRDINPADLVVHLPSIFLLNVRNGAKAPEDFEFRLAGTAVDDLFEHAITGRTVAEGINARVATRLAGPLAAVVEFKRPIRVYGNLPLVAGGEDLSLELLLLPLSGDGKRVDMILGEILTFRGAVQSGAEKMHA